MLAPISLPHGVPVHVPVMQANAILWAVAYGSLARSFFLARWRLAVLSLGGV